MSRDKHRNSSKERRKVGQNPKNDFGSVGNDKNVPEYSQFGDNAIHK